MWPFNLNYVIPVLILVFPLDLNQSCDCFYFHYFSVLFLFQTM